MRIYDLVKDLAAKKKISIAHLERTLDLSNGSISKWNSSAPNSESLNKVADYFDVSVDYLLGRESKYVIKEDPAEEIASFFRKVTNDIEFSEDEEKELEEDFKAYLEFRARQLKNKRKGK